MMWRIWKLNPGKSSPEWTVPNEILRILFWPGWVWLEKQNVGLGASRDVEDLKAEKFDEKMLDLLTQMRATDQAPLRWHMAAGHAISKGNETIVVPRVAHYYVAMFHWALVLFHAGPLENNGQRKGCSRGEALDSRMHKAKTPTGGDSDSNGFFLEASSARRLAHQPLP